MWCYAENINLNMIVLYAHITTNCMLHLITVKCKPDIFNMLYSLSIVKIP